MALRNKKSRFRLWVDLLLENPRGILLRAGAVLLVVLLGLQHLRLSFLTQLEINRSGSLAGFARSLSDPDALAWLARQEHLTQANLPMALDLYRKALENFVLHIPSWLGLAEVYNDQGKKAMGIKALGFAQHFAAKNEEFAWSSALLADTLGDEQILLENLRWLADNQPARRRDVFNLAVLTWNDAKTLLPKFEPSYFMEILETYIRNNDISNSWRVWQEMVRTDVDNAVNATRYAEYLLGQKAFQLAAAVWRQSVNTTGTILYNGNFEHEPLNSAFGWQISTSRGASWSRGNYGSGLRITFDGSENTVFHVSQTVPLRPGKYTLSGTFETDGLTTDQKPYWNIRGVECKGLDVSGEMLPASSQQTEFILRFHVPEQCEVVRVSLRRDKSYSFDNRIAGTVIINNLEITPWGDGKTNASGAAPVVVEKGIGSRISIRELMIRP
ncbi:MAG: hypothetical protein Kow0089_17100 [Desulfobulbaceae bacterium]